MVRKLVAVAVGVGLVAVSVVTCPLRAEQATPAPSASPDPAELVRGLGAAHFAVRERAMQQLMQAGPAAIEALEQGVYAEDREIRFRSRQLLKLLRAERFRRQLRAFAEGRPDPQEQDLPGWALYREQVGSDAAARRLFVEMQKSERELLRTLAVTPDKAYDALANRVRQIQLGIRYEQKHDHVEMGTVAALLFVANNQSRNYTLQTAQYLSSCFHFPSFRSALENGEEREFLRGMLGTWISNSEGWTAYQGIMLAMQYDIPQGLMAAKRLLENTPKQPNQPYFRFYALSAVGRFGSAEDIPALEPFLDDETPYATAVPATRERKHRTQIRDVALAVILHLAKEDPRSYGFDRIRKNSTYLFDPNSLAFADDQQREEAIAKWRASRSQPE